MRSLRHRAGGTLILPLLSGVASAKNAAVVQERGIMHWAVQEPALPDRSRASLKYNVRQLRMAHNTATDPLVFGGCGKKARKQGRILFQMSKWDM